MRRSILTTIVVLALGAALAGGLAVTHGDVHAAFAAVEPATPGPPATAAPAAAAIALPRPPAAKAVSVERVVASAQPAMVDATGTVTPWQEVTISPETGGLIVVDVPVEEGARVAKGQVLVRLDDALLKAQLAQQQAAIDQARANLDAANTAAARGDKLLSTHVISTEEAQTRATTVRTAQALLAAAQAAADATKVQLERTVVRAPFDGVVSSKPVVVGTIVQTGTALMTLMRDGRLEVDAQVPDKALPTIAPGQPATVTDAAGRSIRGAVESIAEKVDPLTRLGTVRVALADSAGLRPGMFARVSIETSADPTLHVAESALVWRDGKPFVYRVGPDGTAQAQPVVTGARQNGEVAIDSGLTAGDRIVVAGAAFLNEGDPVRAVTAEADAGPAAAPVSE